MAFNIDKFASISGQNVASRTLTKWGYQTTDTVATVQATGYFANVKNHLREGHIIEVQHLDSNGDVTETIEYQVVSKTDNVLVVLPKRAGEVFAVGYLADVSTASNVDIAFAGGNVALKKVITILGGAITTADATLTVDDSAGTEIGTITVAYSGSAAGDIDSLTVSGVLDNEFNIATDGGSTVAQELVIVLVGSPDTVGYGDTMLIQTSISDVSGANSSVLIPVGVAGEITGIYTTISGDPGAETELTASIGTTAITGGVVTIANGSAAGAIDSATPTALNVVTAGDYIKIVSDGGASNAVSAQVTFVISK
jgi:hypothetical protein